MFTIFMNLILLFLTRLKKQNLDVSSTLNLKQIRTRALEDGRSIGMSKLCLVDHI